MRPKTPGITPDEVLKLAADTLRSKTTAKIEALRLAQLAITAGAKNESAGDLGSFLLAEFPTGDESNDREALRLIASLQTPGAAEKLVASLEKESVQEKQIHLALVLRYLNEGWEH